MNKDELKAYRKRSDQAIKRGMIRNFDLKPGDIVKQVYWTEYHPAWREELVSYGSRRTQREGVLLYLGVKRRLVDSNAKYPYGYVYCFWDFAAQAETWIFLGYPAYLRGKTFRVLANIKKWKKLVKR